MISNIDQNNVEEAVEVMKKNMTNMMKEGVWVVVAYTKEMIFIEGNKKTQRLTNMDQLRYQSQHHKNTINKY